MTWAKRLQVVAGKPPAIRSLLLVALLTAALAGALVLIVRWRYLIFRNDVDLGIFTQVVASTGSGFSSTAEGGVNHLLVHWSPIIVLAWPFVRVFGPLGLGFLQALLVAATLIPIWGLARARFTAPVALAVTAAASLYPTLWANGVDDFHEMAFVPLLSATFVYALDRRKWRLGILAALLLACTKEDQFVSLAFNGAILAIPMRKDAECRRFGTSLLIIAIVGALFYFGVVRELLQPHVPYLSIRFFDWSGHVPIGPAGIWAVVVPRVRYALVVMAPLLFLPCISRYGWFLLPGFIEILASRQPVTIMPGTHYSALLTGYALAAFVDGTSQLGRWKPQAWAAAVAASALISIGVQRFGSPMENWYYLYRQPNANDALLDATLKRLPPDADVGAEDEVFSHLGLDRNASIDMNRQEWFVYDRTHYSSHWRDVDEPIVRRKLAERAYVVFSDADGIVVLRRFSPGPTGAK